MKSLFRLAPSIQRSCWSPTTTATIAASRTQQCRRSISSVNIVGAPSPSTSILTHPDDEFSDDNLLLSKPTYATLSPTTLNTYALTLPPSHLSLKASRQFFTRTTPTLLYQAAHYPAVPRESPFPEVAVLGRSNAGKSSLFNTLLSATPKAAHKSNHARVSSKAGKTKMLLGYSVGGAGQVGAVPQAGEDARARNEMAWTRMGRGGIVVVDMPGYGQGSREEWGVTALGFLRDRKQLRRVFVLVDARHGVKKSDLEILGLLEGEKIAWSVVLSKVDKILYPGPKEPQGEALGKRLGDLEVVKKKVVETLVQERILKEVGKGAHAQVLCDVLCCSAEKTLQGRAIGIDELRWAIMSACGIEADG
jgi:GTP-binding protein